MDSKVVMRPIICSFFTPEYVHLAKRMIESAQKFGFETDVQAKEKINGRWIDTIYWRAEFIRIMLAKHNNRDVIWLDCDAVILKQPELFEDFQGDFGAHVHDFPWRKNELLGGTMYFANNDSTRDLIERWIHFNKALPNERLSQWVLAAALKHWKGTFIKLPAQYCQIYDLMSDCGDPVISHFQASRRYRNDA